MAAPKPIKSAFAPIKPKPVPIPPPPPKPEAAPAKPVSSVPSGPALPAKPKAVPEPTPPKPLPPLVEIQLEAVDRQDRAVPGWCFTDGLKRGKPVVILVVNLAHGLVQASIKAQDAKTLSWLCGLSLSELLFIRHRDPLFSALQAKLREELLPPEQRSIMGLQFLATTAAQHPALAAAGQLLTTDAALLGRRTQLGSVAL